ncbi:efflux RND transporter periplasmic adaptor subunit [Tsuneonella flava]|uniref:Efflux RND transporter periplasmic adaptor subunit n=1 Tax=Tsuneonella flava TaxID=2055955 RepID=A0ABX7K754_9SPHN|nr:efflux RND transporter periplasmic adaptor subunit [Tsuneonella flava]QSB43362.1 efflux RND transporter periplasmic adaptor subunit [Tsuneonella flava]
MSRFAVNRRYVWLAVVIVVLLAAFAWVALRSGPLAPVDVVLAEAREQPIAPALVGIGTVEARYTYSIGPTAPGRLASIEVDVGDRVSPGQLLGRMDPVDLQQRIAASAEAQGRAAAVERTAEAQIGEAGSRLTLARSDLARAEDLYRGGWLTRAALDQKRQAASAAEAAVAAAVANRDAAISERQRSGADRAAIEAQSANLQLHSPRAGIVVERLAEPGSTVVAGQAVVKVVDPQELWIAARFDQARAAGLRPGLAATVTLRSRPDQKLRGHVLRVEPVADSVTEEVRAKIAFSTGSALPPLGELAEVTVSLPAGKPRLTVPSSAIQTANGKTGVWLVEDGAIAFQPVTLGVEGSDGRIAVESGLAKGDRVVAYSARPLSARSRIRAVDRLK